MIERLRYANSVSPSRAGGNYFKEPPPVFISSGCTLLDLALGGGWPLGRVVNIVGDKSTGKTLLAIEACANFARQFPRGKIYYREAEAAFDRTYAIEVGLPADRVNFGPDGLMTRWSTIEEVFRDLRKIVAWHEKHSVPGLYIVDSLDALSSEAELKREVGAGSFHLDKQKMLGQLFRELVRDFKAASLCVIFVSQTRDKIGFVIGDKHYRSGGRALDFYASQILWLNHNKTIKETIGGIKRATSVRIIAQLKKNKITRPFDRCEFFIRFGFGVDDLKGSVDWLAENKMLGLINVKPSAIDRYMEESERLSQEDYRRRIKLVQAAVCEGWKEVDARFRPIHRKYG